MLRNNFRRPEIQTFPGGMFSDPLVAALPMHLCTPHIAEKPYEFVHTLVRGMVMKWLEMNGNEMERNGFLKACSWKYVSSYLLAL